MVALKLVILGMLGCALWQLITWGSKRLLGYHREHDFFFLTGRLLVNVGSWMIEKRGALMFNYSVTLK